MRKNAKKAFKVWVGIDPDTGRPLLWSISDLRRECRADLDARCWGGGKVMRTTLVIEPRQKKEKKHGK